MTRTITCLNINFESTEYQENLYRYYADFQVKTPVFTTAEGGFYLTRYADCLDLLKDNRFSRRPMSGPSVFCNDNREPNHFEVMINDWMVFQDPPQHTKLREPLTNIFSPKRITAMESDISNITVSLMDSIPCNEPVNFITSFAYVLPLSVICLMLGIEKADYQQFSIWSNTLTTALNTGSNEDIAQGVDVANALQTYFEDHIAKCDKDGNDNILNALLDARNSGSLTTNEVVSICIFMLWAGHETTKQLISNGLLLLLQNPKQMQLLKNDATLIEPVVEEMLRYDSPIQKLSRWTREDTLFGDDMIPENNLVTAIVGAANHDPEIFDRPDEFIINRTPNKHIAFGKGFHHCLGATLARTEAKIAFQELITRYNNISLIDYQWRNLSAFRSLDNLVLTLET